VAVGLTSDGALDKVVTPALPPAVNLVFIGVDRIAALVEVAMDREPLALFPTAHGRDVALQIPGDLLPGVEPFRDARAIRRVEVVASHSDLPVMGDTAASRVCSLLLSHGHGQQFVMRSPDPLSPQGH
jgi:hypothetical protein